MYLFIGALGGGHVRRSEDSLSESFLSFHHTGPRIKVTIVGLGDKRLHPLRHLTTPLLVCFLVVC